MKRALYSIPVAGLALTSLGCGNPDEIVGTWSVDTAFSRPNPFAGQGIDIGGGRYAFYAHLKPGSLRVRPGERVKKGQVVGLVGNSGNSTEPHLHFHLMDNTSPLGSEGIPYVHETFALVGKCARAFTECKRGTPDVRRREMPLADMIVGYPKQ